MKNLENFGVQELSVQECMDVNGGSLTAGIIVGIAIGVAVFGAGWAVGYFCR